MTITKKNIKSLLPMSEESLKWTLGCCYKFKTEQINNQRLTGRLHSLLNNMDKKGQIYKVGYKYHLPGTENETN